MSQRKKSSGDRGTGVAPGVGLHVNAVGTPEESPRTGAPGPLTVTDPGPVAKKAGRVGCVGICTLPFPTTQPV